MNVDEQLEEISSKLAKRVDTQSCYSCGTCVAACPVSRLVGSDIYHPRRVVKATLEGKAAALLTDTSLWLCTSCHSCLEHCPQKVPVSELIQDLQNIASSMGITPDDIVSEVENILATGWALAPSEQANKKRAELGLPPIPLGDRVGTDLQKIAKTTELLERLEKIKQRKLKEAQAAEIAEEGGKV
ncbi:MAG: 4Fe-4S dicluster domain-containing protein [Candidatus Thorarchaeota archaeon]